MKFDVESFLRGPSDEPSDYVATRWLFLRGLGLVNLIAFVSLWVQIDGLVGSHGVSPASAYLDEVRRLIGSQAWYRLPTLCWLDASDATLHALCAAGTLSSLLLVADVCPAPSVAACWGLYLSLVGAGHDFLSFQWDMLLLEADFLAIFLAPLTAKPRRPADGPPPPPAMIWMLRWLLFRLMFWSGLVKLGSRDPSWQNLTAMRYHYETQPLPTPLAWFAHQLPPSFHTLETLGVFAIEMGVPFLLFAPRRWRLLAFFPLVSLQVLIALTGNYGFFNLLTIALCVGAVLDDRVLPARIRAQNPHPANRWPATVVGAACVLLVFLNLPTRALSGLRLVNRYGLFAVMTTERPELVIEGSADGKSWKPYEFRYKPGDVMRAPPLVAPHMPRLDWQMWFAALGSERHNPWLRGLLRRLRDNDPTVLALLAANPFPDAPPVFVRAVTYDYRFSSAGPPWWVRRQRGLYAVEGPRAPPPDRPTPRPPAQQPATPTQQPTAQQPATPTQQPPAQRPATPTQQPTAQQPAPPTQGPGGRPPTPR